MSIPAEIFKAYDIRGVVGDTITEEITFQIGQAIGSEVIKAGKNSIVIGRDGRLSGPSLAKALSDGLRATGVDVTDIGVAPSPVVYFSAYQLNISSCVAITGSHNPPDYNGFKIVIDGTTLSAERIQQLRERIENNALSQGTGSFAEVAVIDSYITRIVDDITLARPMKIVIDCGNGVGGATAPTLFRALGCEVIDLFSEVDGNFPNHHPDPAKLENLQDLIEAVKENDAEIGLAFDGDADRLGVVTSKGEVIWPDRQMILFARDILSRNPGEEIIYDVKCSRTLATEIQNAGGKATMWRTGHSFIKAKLKETGAALAGEMSGHIFFKERWFGFDDGVYAGARLLELLSKREETPQAIFDSLPNTINTPELHIKMENFGEHYTLMDELAKNADFPDEQVSTFDGLRVDFETGFGLIRPSNTTPVLVMRFEGDDQRSLEAIQDKFRELILKTRPTITPPF
ncbi:MAG: phosphomannomutase/phosphoglucomutase [Arenicella sp.]